MKKNKITHCLLGLCVAGAMSAGAEVVFEYSFPASYNGSGTAITDLSATGNNATLSTTSPALIDDRPAGFDASMMSLSGSNGGYGTTTAIDLLNTTAVVANGGFILDVWFKADNTSGEKLIDYAGTEFLKTQNGQIQFGLNGNSFVASTVTDPDQWHHAVGIFDTLGNSAVADSGNVGEFKVDGFASLFLDGELVASKAGTKTGFGDRLDRSIGINRHPNITGEYNQGMIFNPKVELIPEPGTLGMVALFGGGMLLIRRKMMM